MLYYSLNSLSTLYERCKELFNLLAIATTIFCCTFWRHSVNINSLLLSYYYVVFYSLYALRNKNTVPLFFSFFWNNLCTYTLFIEFDGFFLLCITSIRIVATKTNVFGVSSQIATRKPPKMTYDWECALRMKTPVSIKLAD